MAGDKIDEASQSKAKEKLDSQEAIVNRFNALRQEIQLLSSKATELDIERQEHDLVLEALNSCNDDKRRCFRLVGGVLVERTVGEVKPAVTRFVVPFLFYFVKNAF